MKNILDYSINELSAEIYDELINHHYEVENEYQKVDDIEDEENMIELITEILDEEYGENEQYNHLVAGILYIKMKDELIEDIMQRDEDASEAYEDKMFDYNNLTLPR